MAQPTRKRNDPARRKPEAAVSATVQRPEWLVCGLAAAVAPAAGEPTFLAKAEVRCTTCHYSPTGGGLLTAYGRLQSRQELSTSDGDSEQFLWGAFGESLGPVNLGIDARPTHLRVAFPGGTSSRFLLMNADLLAAVAQEAGQRRGPAQREAQVLDALGAARAFVDRRRLERQPLVPEQLGGRAVAPVHQDQRRVALPVEMANEVERRDRRAPDLVADERKADHYR